MADESVHVHIRVTSDQKQIAATRRELERLALAGKAADGDFGDLNDTLDEHDKRQKKIRDSSTSSTSALNLNAASSSNLGNKMKKSGKDMDSMSKSSKALTSGLKVGLKFALIGSAIELAAVGVAIASVNGLFAIGTAAAKVYRFAMQGLAAGIAVGIGALAAFAAAQRQYNAAVNGFSYKSAPALGASVNQSMAALRNLTSDSRVAVFGMENLNAAFANVSKNTNLTKPLQDALAGVGDFAVAAGGDIGKNFAQAAEFVGLLQKEGKLTDDLMSSADKVGPKFAEALKASGKTGAADIMTLLSSGALAESAGVTGALGAVNNTLMGQFKGFFTEMQSRFADLGQTFLPGITKAFAQIQVIARTTFTRISGTMSGINTGGFFDSVVKVTDKLADMFVNFFDKYLPKSQKMFSGVGALFGKINGYWDSFVRGMDKLRNASSVITNAFGPAFKQIFEGFGGSINMFAKLLTDNQDKFVDFGAAMVTAFKGIQEFFNGFKQFIVANLPLISTLIGGLGTILGLIGKVIGGLASLNTGQSGKGSGVLGSLASLLAVGGLAVGMSALGSKGKLGTAGGAITRKVTGGKYGNKAGGIGGVTTMNATTVNLYTSKLNQMGAPGIKGQPVAIGPGAGGGKPVPKGQLRGGARIGASKLSGGGAMAGSMLGIAAASQFANSDADPYLAAGGMISMINPLAGAGVAGLGTAATSKTIGGGAVSGALGGAATGALIGSILPGVGTAIGAGVGLAVGATFGALMGQMNADTAQRKVAKGQGQDLIRKGAGADIFTSLLGEADVDSARARVDALTRQNDRAQTVFRQFKETETALGVSGGFSNTKIVEEMDKRGIKLTAAEKQTLSNQKRLKSYYDGQQEQTEALIGLAPGIDKFQDQTNRLAGITGTTTKEIAHLAQKMGVDLLDPTRTLTQNLKDLGLATVLTAEQIQGAQREIYAKNIQSVFGQAKKIQESQLALNQAAEGIRQGGLGTTGAGAADFTKALLEQQLNLSGGDPIQAMKLIQTGFLGQDGKLTGDAFKNALSPLYGREEIFHKVVEGNTEGLTALQMLLEVISKSLIEINSKTAMNTLTAIAGGGLQVAGGNEYGLNTAIQSQLDLLTKASMGDENALVATGISTRNMDGTLSGPTNALQIATQKLEGLTGLAGQIAQGKIVDESGNTMTGEALAKTVEGLLSFYGITTDLMKQPDAGKALDEKTQAAMDAITKTFGESPPWMKDVGPDWYGGAGPGWLNEAPNWYDSPIILQNLDGTATVNATPGDTTTSRLGRTMARHASYDGNLPGKRTVTSSLRDYGLGSLNSDHLTGNAYDLTGQNLVGYATQVNQSGGFAEFHGAGAGRHLHVVPGQTPIGDSVSSMTPMISGGSAGGSYAYTINVYPSAGQDAGAIAQEVMNRIESKEKSTRERA